MYVYVSISRGARILFYTDFPSLSARGLTARPRRAIMEFSGLLLLLRRSPFSREKMRTFTQKKKRSEIT